MQLQSTVDGSSSAHFHCPVNAPPLQTGSPQEPSAQSRHIAGKAMVGGQASEGVPASPPLPPVLFPPLPPVISPSVSAEEPPTPPEPPSAAPPESTLESLWTDPPDPALAPLSESSPVPVLDSLLHPIDQSDVAVISHKIATTGHRVFRIVALASDGATAHTVPPIFASRFINMTPPLDSSPSKVSFIPHIVSMLQTIPIEQVHVQSLPVVRHPEPVPVYCRLYNLRPNFLSTFTIAPARFLLCYSIRTPFGPEQSI